MQESVARIVAAIQAGRYREAGTLIEQGLADRPAEILAHRVDMARWMLLAANWPLVTRLLMPGTNFFLESGWLESLVAGKPVDKAGQPIPWYTYPAIEFLEPRVQSGFRVFEFGAGWSTLWWARRVAEVAAVEHDAAWHASVASALPGNAGVALCTEREAYVGELARRGGLFDVIVVDGEWRNECARAAAARLKPSGALVFDNSDRTAFADGVRYLSEQGWLRVDFFGLVASYPYKNCTSLFFRDTCWLQAAPVPSRQFTSIGASCSQAMKD
jgi:hypothetical protein